jgi:hypothetical protein
MQRPPNKLLSFCRLLKDHQINKIFFILLTEILQNKTADYASELWYMLLIK